MERFSDPGRRVRRSENLQLFIKFAEEINSKPFDKLDSQDMSFLLLKQISSQMHRQNKLLEILTANILQALEDPEKNTDIDPK